MWDSATLPIDPTGTMAAWAKIWAVPRAEGNPPARPPGDSNRLPDNDHTWPCIVCRTSRTRESPLSSADCLLPLALATAAVSDGTMRRWRRRPLRGQAQQIEVRLRRTPFEYGFPSGNASRS